jgi:ribosomal protein L21E
MKDIYKEYEKWDKVEILVENGFWEMIAHIEYWNGYVKSEHHKSATIKVRQKKEWKRKERLI